MTGPLTPSEAELLGIWQAGLDTPDEPKPPRQVPSDLPTLKETPAFKQWHAEIRHGARTTTQPWDDLWRAACEEVNAQDWLRLEMPTAAQLAKRDAERFLRRYRDGIRKRLVEDVATVHAARARPTMAVNPSRRFQRLKRVLQGGASLCSGLSVMRPP